MESWQVEQHGRVYRVDICLHELHTETKIGNATYRWVLNASTLTLECIVEASRPQVVWDVNCPPDVTTTEVQSFLTTQQNVPLSPRVVETCVDLLNWSQTIALPSLQKKNAQGRHT
jgi:hypothetical protein